MVKMCKFYIYCHVFLWRVVNPVKKKTWRLLCICFAFAFAFALLCKLLGSTRGS